MNDVVFIQDLKIKTCIGLYDWERAIQQELVISAKLFCDITKAAQSDDVQYVVNYKTVCEDIERLCHEIQAKLLESLAEQICAYILNHYPCHCITLTIQKPNAITKAQSVGVQITRTNSKT